MRIDEDAQPNYRPRPYTGKKRLTTPPPPRPAIASDPNCQRCFGDNMERSFDPVDGHIMGVLNNHCDHRPFVEGEPMFRPGRTEQFGTGATK